MKKFRVSLVSVAFLALIGLVLLFLIRLMLHRPPELLLPSTDASESAGVVAETEQETIRRVEVTPETVQMVIERMNRPDSYRSTFLIRRYWEGGSGENTVDVRVSGNWMQVDTSGENVRHVVTGGGKVWIWYAGSSVYHGTTPFSADEEQGIPTYEDVLLLDTAAIAAADYELWDTTPCVYVETARDSSGYTDRYWIDAGNGLLAAAERVFGDSVVYHMSRLSVDTESDNGQPFTLPDGSVLYQPEAD